MAFKHVEIPYLKYHEALKDGEFRSFNEKIGLKYIGNIPDNIGYNKYYFLFEIIDEKKWFLAKIEYGL